VLQNWRHTLAGLAKRKHRLGFILSHSATLKRLWLFNRDPFQVLACGSLPPSPFYSIQTISGDWAQMSTRAI
jgi:hypothetical protein